MECSLTCGQKRRVSVLKRCSRNEERGRNWEICWKSVLCNCCILSTWQQVSDFDHWGNYLMIALTGCWDGRSLFHMMKLFSPINWWRRVKTDAEETLDPISLVFIIARKCTSKWTIIIVIVDVWSIWTQEILFIICKMQSFYKDPQFSTGDPLRTAFETWSYDSILDFVCDTAHFFVMKRSFN